MDVHAAPLPPAPAVRRLRALVLAGIGALIALGLAWEMWLAPTGRGTWALKVLPLMLCLPGLMRHRLFTYRALALLLWLYVLEAAVRGASEGGISRALAGLQLALGVAVFAACCVYIRGRLRGARAVPA